MQFSESAPQITPGTGLKTKAPRILIFGWAVFSLQRPSEPYLTPRRTERNTAKNVHRS